MNLENFLKELHHRRGLEYIQKLSLSSTKLPLWATTLPGVVFVKEQGGNV